MQRQVVWTSLACGALLGWASLAPAQQQMLRGQVRGSVVDAAGKGIPGVTVEMDLEGKHPKKLVLTTDKKGGYVRVGIPEGNYKFTFRKDGYKPAACTVWISLGGLSEVPPETLQALDSPAAGGPATGTGLATAGGSAATSAVPPAEAASVKTLFDKANAAIAAGQWDEAESLMKESCAVAPNFSAAHYNLGWIYEHKKDFTQAANEYRQAKDLEPTRADSHFALVRVLIAAGQQDEAGQVLQGAAAQLGQDALAQLDIGINCFNLGLAEQATAAFQKVQEVDPANPEPLYFLSMLALQKGLVADAVAKLEKYIALAGQNPQNLAAAKTMLVELKKSLPRP